MILSRWQKLLQEVVVLYLNATHANKYRLFSPLIFVLNIYKILVYEVIGEDKIFRHERIFLKYVKKIESNCWTKW